MNLVNNSSETEAQQASFYWLTTPQLLLLSLAAHHLRTSFKNTADIMDFDCACPICTTPFSTDPNDPYGPIAGKCQDYVCRNCVESLVEEAVVIECPVCTQPNMFDKHELVSPRIFCQTLAALRQIQQERSTDVTTTSTKSANTNKVIKTESDGTSTTTAEASSASQESQKSPERPIIAQNSGNDGGRPEMLARIVSRTDAESDHEHSAARDDVKLVATRTKTGEKAEMAPFVSPEEFVGQVRNVALDDRMQVVRRLKMEDETGNDEDDDTETEDEMEDRPETKQRSSSVRVVAATTAASNARKRQRAPSADVAARQDHLPDSIASSDGLTKRKKRATEKQRPEKATSMLRPTDTSTSKISRSGRVIKLTDKAKAAKRKSEEATSLARPNQEGPPAPSGPPEGAASFTAASNASTNVTRRSGRAIKLTDKAKASDLHLAPQRKLPQAAHVAPAPPAASLVSKTKNNNTTDSHDIEQGGRVRPFFAKHSNAGFGSDEENGANEHPSDLNDDDRKPAAKETSKPSKSATRNVRQPTQQIPNRQGTRNVDHEIRIASPGRSNKPTLPTASQASNPDPSTAQHANSSSVNSRRAASVARISNRDQSNNHLEPAVTLSEDQEKYLKTMKSKAELKEKKTPGKKTASWSLLKALYSSDKDTLTKSELKEAAEPYYGEKLEVEEHHLLHSAPFGAWSSIKTLERHELVERGKHGGKGDSFWLTANGRVFCADLFVELVATVQPTKPTTQTTINSFFAKAVNSI